MIIFNEQDFLEFFETKQIIDPENNINQYSTTKDDLAYFIYIESSIQFVGLAVTSPGGAIINIGLHSIARIICDRSEGTVKFYFYQEGKFESVAMMMVKPSIAIVANVPSL